MTAPVDLQPDDIGLPIDAPSGVVEAPMSVGDLDPNELGVDSEVLVQRPPVTLDTEGDRAVDAFIQSITLPLVQPILATPPRLRVSKVRDEDWVPRRSSRLAAKNARRLANPEAQATKVMLQRMDPISHQDCPDESVFKNFQETFKAPLSSSKREALRELFPCRRRRPREADT